MAKLTHDFFNGDTVAIAQALLGKYLVRNRNGELLAGRITETEAYVGRATRPATPITTAVRPGRKRCSWLRAMPTSISSTGCTTV